MRDRRRGRIAGWILLALAGLAVAVALSVTASNLSTQPIGLSGMGLRASDNLAPGQASANTARTTTTDATTSPATVPSTTTSGDTDHDHGRDKKPDSDDD